MKIQIGKPVTAGQRSLIKIKNVLSKKSSLLKNCLLKLKKSTGRNNSGKQTVFHKGGGQKKRYRVLNFTKVLDYESIVTTIEYDPYRTANIASVYDFIKKTYRYVLAPQNLKIGDIIKSGATGEIKLGHSILLSKIPVGSLIYNITLKTNGRNVITRSAGTYSILIEKSNNICQLKVSSNGYKSLSASCSACLGTVSNELHFIKVLGKAGRSRWLNIKPTVRGVAMNPIDHPHGGGEGKKSKKKLSPWGKRT